jgi:hypothetical protein
MIHQFFVCSELHTTIQHEIHLVLHLIIIYVVNRGRITGFSYMHEKSELKKKFNVYITK